MRLACSRSGSLAARSSGLAVDGRGWLELAVAYIGVHRAGATCLLMNHTAGDPPAGRVARTEPAAEPADGEDRKHRGVVRKVPGDAGGDLSGWCVNAQSALTIASASRT